MNISLTNAFFGKSNNMLKFDRNNISTITMDSNSPNYSFNTILDQATSVGDYSDSIFNNQNNSLNNHTDIKNSNFTQTSEYYDYSNKADTSITNNYDNKMNNVNNDYDKININKDDKTKIKSDIKALESDLKRLEELVDNQKTKKAIRQIRKKIENIKETIDKDSVNKEEIINAMSFLKKVFDLLNDITKNNGLDFNRTLDMINSINNQMKNILSKDESNILINTLNELSNIIEKDIEKSNIHSKNKELSGLKNQIKKLIENLDNKEQIIIKDKSQIEFIKDFISKLKDLKSNLDSGNFSKNIDMIINKLDKSIDKFENIFKFNIEIRDNRVVKKSNKDLNTKGKINNIESKSSTTKDNNNVQNSNEIKTELFTKSNTDISNNIISRNTSSILGESQNNSILNAKDIFSQVIKKASIMLKDNKSEIVIQLKPETLGKVKMKLLIEKGDISGKLIVESNEVKKIIQNHITELKDALEDKGMMLNSLDISLGNEFKDFELQNSDLEFNSMFNSENDEISEIDESMDEQSQQKSELPEWMAGNVNISG